MKRRAVAAVGLIAMLTLARSSGIAVVPAPSIDDRPSGPLAPPIRSTAWLNSAPLAPGSLRGRVVLVEFWTFDCINCRRTVPAMRALDRALRDSGLVVIGVHTPELDHERPVENVRRAVQKLGVSFPVAIDGDASVWRAFGNRYWPALYLIDRRGVIRLRHIGELHVGTTEWDELGVAIQRLLREPARNARSPRVGGGSGILVPRSPAAGEPGRNRPRRG